jgi:hypothetical protein
MSIAISVPNFLAFQDYDALQDTVTRRLDREDLIPEYNEYCALTEEELNQAVWAPDREQVAYLVASEVSERVALPDDFWAMRACKIGATTLKQSTPQNTFNDRSLGVPCTYSIEGRELVLEPAPDTTIDQNLEIKILYWKSIGPLPQQQTNWLLERHPSLYLLGMLKYAESRAMNHELSAAYHSEMMERIQKVNYAGNKQRHGGGSLQMVVS